MSAFWHCESLVFSVLPFSASWAATLFCNLDLLQKTHLPAGMFCTKTSGSVHGSRYSHRGAKGRFSLSWLVSKKPKLAYYPCGGTWVQILSITSVGDSGCKAQKEGAAANATLGSGCSWEKEKCSLPLKQGDFQLLTPQLDVKSSSGSCQQNVEWV